MSASAFFTSELCRNNKTDMACFDKFGEAILTSLAKNYDEEKIGTDLQFVGDRRFSSS